MSEHDEQAAFIKWTRLAVGRRPALAFFFAIPNGGHRHKATAAKLKAEGVRAGVPDLFLPVPIGEFHGLFLEMKAQNHGRTSVAQVEWLHNLAELGYATAITFGLDNAIRATNLYLDGDLPPGIQTFKT